MKTYFDTGILIGLLITSHPEHAVCLAEFEASSERLTCGHALAETFASLNSHFKVPNDVAAELTLALLEIEDFRVEPLSIEDYKAAISEARQRGVMGGGIYDSLHATFARRRGVKRIVTLNGGDFRHVAPDIEIVTP